MALKYWKPRSEWSVSSGRDGDALTTNRHHHVMMIIKLPYLEYVVLRKNHFKYVILTGG